MAKKNRPKDPPDTSWIRMECICCLGYEHHVSQWRKLRDRLARKAAHG